MTLTALTAAVPSPVIPAWEVGDRVMLVDNAEQGLRPHPWRFASKSHQLPCEVGIAFTHMDELEADTFARRGRVASMVLASSGHLRRNFRESFGR